MAIQGPEHRHEAVPAGFRRIFLYCNAALAGLATLVVLVFAAYAVAPNSLNSAATLYSRLYYVPTFLGFDSAMEDLRAGDPAKAAAILEKWRDIRMGDRAYRFKRDLFLELAAHWQAERQFDRIIDASAPFVDLDEPIQRDVILFQIWAEAAVEIPALAPAARRAITLQWQRFPTNFDLTELYMDHVFDWRAEPDRARELIRAARSFYYSYDWLLVWSGSEDFSDKHEVPLTFEGRVDGTMTAEAALPAEARYIRVAPAAGKILDIRAFRIFIDENDLPVDFKALKVNDMNPVGPETFRTTGGIDPYIHLAVESNGTPIDDVGGFKVEISLEVRPPEPDWADRMLNKIDAL